MEQVIRRSAALHLQHIATGGIRSSSARRARSTSVTGLRRLEQMTGHGMRHGEAVGIGIAIDSTS